MIPVVSLKPLNTEEGRRNPYPFYAQLHQHGPICMVEPGEGRFDFVVHGYDAVAHALRDPAFRVMDSSQLVYQPTWEQHRARAVFMNSIVFSNAPRHTLMRHLFSQTFTARRVTALEPAVVQITDDLLDRLAGAAAGENTVDFMAEFAFPLPANVLGELLGVPEKDRAWYRPRARALGLVLEFGINTVQNLRRADDAAVELCDFFDDLVAQRRKEPQQDLITALVQAQDAEGATLTPYEFLANLVVLFNAGFVTTTHLLGNGLTLLLDHPEALAHLRANPEHAPGYVEEILRCEGPLHFAVRWAASDTEIAGTAIPQGTRVILLSAAANRDPARFPDPDRFDPSRFDPHRPDNQTLSFGAGPHYCLGAALARIEGRHGFTRLLDRFSSIRLAEPPAIPRQLTLRGHERLWLHLS
jgi:cytochrome P450